MAGLETTYSGGNGFSTSYNSQRWLNLYLSACKLLDLALALPSESLPQFQMYVRPPVYVGCCPLPACCGEPLFTLSLSLLSQVSLGIYP